MKDVKCKTLNCKNMARARSDHCRGCAGVWSYWERKIDKLGPQVVFDRQRALDKWADRMTYLGTRDKEYANVTRFFKRRK